MRNADKRYSYAPDPFKKMIGKAKKLEVASAVYIVNRDKYGREISSREFRKRIKEIEDKFLSFFGGYTNDTITHGEFKTTDSRIIDEKVARISSFSDVRCFKEHRDEIQRWLLKKKKEWNQETIAYEFEGDLYYL